MTYGEVAMQLINTAAVGLGYFFLKEKLALEGKKTRNDTSSPDQVERLQRDVTFLRGQVNELNERVAKAIPPDDRGPTKAPYV